MAHPQPAFSLAQARHLVKHLFTPNPAIYWADFLASIVGGMICFKLVRRDLPLFSLAQALVFVLCGLLFYRASLFTHEMTHMRAGTFRWFRVAWNLLCGIPMLMPSFMYYSHVDHHMRKHFGTQHDGEYLPLGTQSPWHIGLYLCQPLLFPLVAVLRFGLFTPLSWISPKFRNFVHQRCSSMVMDPTYIRPLPPRNVLRVFRLQEAMCFLWLAGLVTVMSLGIVPLGFMPTVYLLSVFVLLLNNIRTLGAHRYTNVEGEMTFVEQLLDSVNYPNHPILSSLWAPVGLRFHALHHLFPTLPYHNLAKAHKKLMAELPADSPYRLTESSGLTVSLVQLWRNSRNSASRAAHSRPQKNWSVAPDQWTDNARTGAA